MFNQKDLLAKLLATEDVTVLHANAKTASFNVKDRVLTLPLWNDMTNETYDHLTGHEVGHALYTPYEGWTEELDKNLGPGFKSFLNVVEDARIEKLVQRRYPGLRRSFVMSYKKMLADGMFGGDVDKLNTLPLIDRINTLFKVGQTSGVRIEDDEQVWVDEISKLETWDEVVDVATRLYEYAKLKKEEDEELAQDMEDDFEDSEDEGEPDDQLEVGDGDEETETEDEDGDEDDNESEKVRASGEDDVSSKTDEALTNNINANYNNDSGIEVKNLMLNNADVSPLIVGYKKIIKDFEDYDTQLRVTGEIIDWMGEPLGMMSRGEKHFKKFQANNKKSIAYMIKEFEMRKSAAEYSRATTSKSGVIDPIKMNSYLYNEDIFKKVTNIPEGKSHGMIMYLDWSGSMCHDMKATVDQLLNLVHFCRNVNIPFRVYAFTDGYERHAEQPTKFDGLMRDEVAVDTLYHTSGTRYLEFFNSKMNKKDFINMSKYLLSLARDHRKAPYDYGLSGTPLDATIMSAIKLHELFLKNHRVDIVNTIFLSDGDSHPMNVNTSVGDYMRSSSLSDLMGWRFKGVINLIDPVSKKKYTLPSNENSRMECTELFLKIYRERTGSTTIGFRILPTGTSRISRELRYLGWNVDCASMAKKMRKEKYCVIPSTGYTKYFGIAGGRELETANGSFEVAKDATTAQLRYAFNKASKGKVTSRALLNEFIKEVA